eukprot:TRINITY_DN2012_c0_g1_i11.p2 TRINITY_DN2012_c0_g1~~TRINITY_DN2012_c0_g1_i11.p2  ORF type:complete len:124 (-),score=32.74 TRINITY_DN2012_c0_g1_i11:267-638(-)
MPTHDRCCAVCAVCAVLLCCLLLCAVITRAPAGVRSDQIGTTNKHGVIKGQGFAQADLRVNRYVARGARKLASEADVLSRIVERQVHGQQMKLKRMENVFNRRTVVLNEQHYRPENIRSWDAA